ncbi:MAG: hypothetical protein R3C03_18545 [Pirellulaceae bacterium]
MTELRGIEVKNFLPPALAFHVAVISIAMGASNSANLPMATKVTLPENEVAAIVYSAGGDSVPTVDEQVRER